MEKYLVHIERNGERILVGTLVGESYRDACFSYSTDYLSDPLSKAISLQLPLQEVPFSAEKTKNYFDGLLPEGFTRQTVAQWMRLNEKDYLSLLHGLGRECIGALQITSEEEVTEAGYEKISEEQVRALAAEGAKKSAELVIKTHLSLTGASGKVGLYYDDEHDLWYLPQGTAPSTHIVKQSHVRLDGIVTNEQLCLRTASRCGIEVPVSFILDTGVGEEMDVLFATQRYDRIFPKQSSSIDGLPRPLRLHQEDFGQAMGIPAGEKYEIAGEHHMSGMFRLLRRYSDDPVRDQLKLWDQIVFNCLIGNTDAHVKNFSLLYDKDLRTVHLAPAYDIVSTAVYEMSTRNLAFHIGDATTIDEIDKESFRAAAKEIGLGEKLAMRHVSELAERFLPALKESAEELSEEGYPKASEFAEKIRENGKRFFL